MANKRQKKKNAKKNYEGQQYRGGRSKEVKNLVKTDIGFKNQHGVEFTREEKKALEQAVNTANRKRARLLAAEAKLPRKSGGKDTGDTVATLHLMNKESDFILAKKTKSLQRFKTKEQYENYMGYLRTVNKRDYVNKRVDLYKENYITAVKENLGDQEIIDKIESMSRKEYMKMVQENDEDLEIHYIYGPDQKVHKINTIRRALGMTEVPVPIDDEEQEIDE